MAENKTNIRSFYKMAGMQKNQEPELDLGPLSKLPGKWESSGTGWNMIALPFAKSPPAPAGFKYRVLMNQYDEKLVFSFVDSGVPNRGLKGIIDDSAEFDQFAVTLDYQQTIEQKIANDFPPSNVAGAAGQAIHHEPGLWLYMKNLRTEGIDIARLASIPHGNSVLALGVSEEKKGAPDIPVIKGLPIGRLGAFDTDPYLAPFKHFIDNPFFGNIPLNTNGFPGFHPLDMNAILRFANQGVNIAKTTTLSVDTTLETGGISNIPFVTKQAEPVSMKSTFWIQELADKKDPQGNPKLRMQYSQVVMLDFFRPRQDSLPDRAQWPHISINTLEKVYDNY